MRPRGVLFDLDDTLFDHHHATECATAALHESEAAFSCWSRVELRGRHSQMLELIHQDVVAGRLQVDEARRERFRRLLLAAGADEAATARAAEIARDYRREYERGWRAVAGAIELLTALKAADIGVAVVTNNIRSEQVLKLERCGLAGYVDALITSEEIGIPKPGAEMYAAALLALQVEASAAAMIGDVWDTDIAGALAAGVRPIWFNWRGLPSRDPNVPEIASLSAASTLLGT